MGLLTLEASKLLTLLPDLGDSFGLPCSASIGGLLPCLVVTCFVLFGCRLLETCSFLRMKQKKSGPGRGAGEDLEGVERRETVVGMYRVREDSVFNLKIVILIILGSFDMMKACGFLTARVKK